MIREGEAPNLSLRYSSRSNMTAFIQVWTAAATLGPARRESQCNLNGRILSLASPAAALILSLSTLQPLPAHSQEGPLIFDHDQSLAGANFSNRSDLRGSIFSKSNCKGANFAGSDLTNAQLDDANFMEANLEGAIFVNAMATNAKFQNANLKNTDFTNANLVSALFDGADIEGADFSDSLLGKATVLKLCKKAAGVNPKTGVSTVESLMCPE